MNSNKKKPDGKNSSREKKPGTVSPHPQKKEIHKETGKNGPAPGGNKENKPEEQISGSFSGDTG